MTKTRREKKKIKLINIEIPEELYYKLKLMCKNEGCTISGKLRIEIEKLTKNYYLKDNNII